VAADGWYFDMSSTINATTVGVGGIVTTADNSGILILQTASTNAVTISAAQGITLAGTLGVTGITTVAAGSAAAPSIVSTTGTSDTGEFFPAADTIAWSTAGTERMRIDSSGNVGIGISTVPTKLSIQMNTNTAEWLQFRNNNAGSSATGGILLGNDSNASAGALILNSSTAATLGQAGGVVVGTLASTALSFMTATTERMRIDSSGNLLVGSTTTSNTSGTGIKLIPTESSVSGRARLSIITVESTSATSGFSLYSTGAAAYRFYIDNDGKPYSTLPLGTISDARLKTNIKNISYGLEDLLKIRPVNFDWKDGSDTNRVGFIAQELKPIISQAVTDTKNIAEDETPYMAVTESNLIPVMVKAIQELKAIIDTQATRITALETA
jgi:hypothetical protein